MKVRKPPGIIIHSDSQLSEPEMLLRNTIEDKISPLTYYDPKVDNKRDRGEVKSLAFVAIKGMLYFAAHDNQALLLIDKAEKWSTGLDNVQSIRMYELIYYLSAIGIGDKDNLIRVSSEIRWTCFIKLNNCQSL